MPQGGRFSAMLTVQEVGTLALDGFSLEADCIFIQ